MTFASPLWLVGLLPWLGVALYLLWGRRKRRDVPFLELWRGPAAVEHAKWKVSAPPIALAMALLAMLAAILGAARPGAPWGAQNNAISVVIDRGITLSARGANDLRFRETGRDAADEITRVFGAGAPIDAWAVPGRKRDDAVNVERFNNPTAWSQTLDRLPPTAINSTEAVPQIVRRALAGGSGPIVVLSDAALGINDPRIVQVTPSMPVRNAGITLLSARTSPRPQIMVRVRNDSPMASAALEVNFGDTGDALLRQMIDLPPAGGQRDFFIDAKRLGPVVSAALFVPDDLEADNKAWLVRESTWPRVALGRPAGALSRLIDVYTQLHPPGDGSRLVRIVSQPDDLALGESGIVIDPGAADASGHGKSVQPTRVMPHPITDSVRGWASMELPAGDGKPPADWTVVLSSGDQPLLATHELPGARQVWVGLSPTGWADRPEYVAFWTAVIDWAGGVGSEGEAYVSYPLDRIDPSWRQSPGDELMHDPGTWPGIYHRSDGAMRAFNASPTRFTPPAPANPPWHQKLARLRTAGPGFRDFSAIPMLASAAFILLAAATWRKAPAVRGRASSK